MKLLIVITLIYVLSVSTLAQTVSAQVRVRITGLPDGERAEGKAVSLVNGVLSFVADGEAAARAVPLDAISRIDVPRGNHSRLAATAGGFTVGALSFIAAYIATFSLCGDDNSQCINRAVPLVFGGPIASGAVVAYLIRRGSWRQISPTELERELSRRQP